MFQSLFDFFYNLFTLTLASGDTLEDLYFNVNTGNTTRFVNGEMLIESTYYSFDAMSYFSLVCSLISLIFIVVLCCLFIYRLIRLVGRLFSGGTL